MNMEWKNRETASKTGEVILVCNSRRKEYGLLKWDGLWATDDLPHKWRKYDRNNTRNLEDFDLWTRIPEIANRWKKYNLGDSELWMEISEEEEENDRLDIPQYEETDKIKRIWIGICEYYQRMKKQEAKEYVPKQKLKCEACKEEIYKDSYKYIGKDGVYCSISCSAWGNPFAELIFVPGGKDEPRDN